MQNVTDYEISRSKQGVKIWKDRTETFKMLPTFLTGQYFFQTPTKGNKNKAWSIQFHGPSTVYVVTKGEKAKSKPIGKREVDPSKSENKRQQNGVDGKNDAGKHPDTEKSGASSEEKKSETTNGWFKQEGSVVTSSNVSFTIILGKNLEGKGINRIKLQPIKSDEDWRIIFITGITRYLIVFVSINTYKFYVCLMKYLASMFFSSLKTTGGSYSYIEVFSNGNQWQKIQLFSLDRSKE